jgi:hypothetical protein
MHTIASAIAGSLRTSTAPTGSRLLPGCPAQPRETPLGRPVQLWGNQRSRGRRLPRSISLSFGSLSRSNGRDLSWRPVQLLVYAVVHSESAAGPPVQPRVYAVTARNAAGIFKPLQVVRSSDGLDFPWVAGPAAGLRSGPLGKSGLQGRQSKPRALAANLRQAILPLSSYGPFGRAMASTPPGGRCSCRTQ